MNFLCDNIWSEKFVLYHKTLFPRKTWLNTSIEIEALLSKTCLFKFRWKKSEKKKVKKKRTLLQLSLLSMPEYAWMCVNKQDPEYTSCLKYTEILNVAKSLTWQGSQMRALYSVLNMPAYALTELWIYLARILNMAGFWICKS